MFTYTYMRKLFTHIQMQIPDVSNTQRLFPNFAHFVKV